MKRIVLTVAALVMTIMMLPVKASAGSHDNNADETDPLEMDFDTNIQTPTIPKKLRATVLENIRSNVAHLRKQGLDATAVRSQEAIAVTIPCDELFAANSTTLLPDAYSSKLKIFGPYLHQPQLYKVIIAVYSDNTGSEEYADALTEARAAAIDDCLSTSVGQQALIVPYGMGMDDPVADNNTRVNRRKNRRVEIYLIPDKPLFQKIK